MTATNGTQNIVGILERLLNVRQRRRWSQGEMASYLGLTAEAYRALEKGRTIRLEWETILRLMDVLDGSGLSIDWFFGRNLSASVDATSADAEIDAGTRQAAEVRLRQALDRATSSILSEEASRPPLPTPVFRVPRPRRKRGFRSQGADVPVLDLGQAALAVRSDGLVLPAEKITRLRLTPPADANAFGVRVRGGALAGGYKDGDIAICTRGRPIDGQPGLLVLKTPECLLAVWKTEPGGRVRIHPIDADLPVRTVSPDDVSAEFAVVRRLSGTEARAAMVRS